MVKLGIVGTGSMANTHAVNFKKIKQCKVIACCDVNEKNLKDFSKRHKIENTFTNLDKMFSTMKLDAVSVVTPDVFHAKVSLKAIEKGLNVLCEKPLATNVEDAKKMLLSSKKRKVITAVNFSYRNSAAVEKASEMVAKGKLGNIIHIEARYFQSWLPSKKWGNWRKSPNWLWRLSKKHHSMGVLGDIGVHLYNLVSFIAGDFNEINCVLKTFDKGIRRIGEYTLDANDSFISTVKFKNGAIGTMHSSRWATGYGNSILIKVFGDKGAIEIDLDKSWDCLRVCIGKDVDKFLWKEIKCSKIPTIYERFITSVIIGKECRPNFEDGVKTQLYLDKSFESDKLKKWVTI
jgi:predicted dehydrogenase